MAVLTTGRIKSTVFRETAGMYETAKKNAAYIRSRFDGSLADFAYELGQLVGVQIYEQNVRIFIEDPEDTTFRSSLFTALVRFCRLYINQGITLKDFLFGDIESTVLMLGKK
jgi:hypothetical protein